MEQIVEQIKQAIAAAVSLITAQKQTIAELKGKLAEVSSEYAQFQADETQEDAATDAVFAQLAQIADSLSTVVSEAQSQG